MSTQVQRIAARHILAANVGDPRQLLELFKKVSLVTAKYEADLPELRRLQRDDIPELKFRSKTREFWNDPQFEEARATLKKYEMAVRKLMVSPKYDYENLVKFGAQTLFLSILQQLELPPKLRKQVESCSKFYSRSRVQMSTEETAIDVYTKMLEGVRQHAKIAEEALRVGRPHSAETNTKIPAGSFTLINSGGFSTEDVTEAVKIVEKAEKLMRSIGLGKVCYGDIMLTQRIAQANLLAFYLVGKDEMFIRVDLKGKAHDAVRTTCHELAHRAQFMFLKDRTAEIKAIYKRLAHISDSDEDLKHIRDAIKPGDTLKYKGETLIVDQVLLTHRGDWSIKLKVEGDPASFRMSLKNYAEVKGLLSTAGKFVTNYAKKDPDENFAEMVATHALGQLPQDQVEMLEPLLKSV